MVVSEGPKIGSVSEPDEGMSIAMSIVTIT